ncbi:MAG: dTMP kinase [Clostridia bacterium]|nr:dTMP kinase [Clostridia bacterium]
MVPSGLFITIEGPDGSGKTTQMERLEVFLRRQGLAVECTREPGGTPLAEAIRRLLLVPHYGPVDARAEILLYAAARAQHVAERIRPALAAGKIVLCDRFSDSTLAYQGYGRGLGAELVHQVNDLATGGLEPDLTLLIDVPVEVGLARRRGLAADRMEQEELAFHQRVRQGYLELSRREPGRVRRVDGTGTPDAVWAQVEGIVVPWLAGALPAARAATAGPIQREAR